MGVGCANVRRVRHDAIELVRADACKPVGCEERYIETQPARIVPRDRQRDFGLIDCDDLGARTLRLDRQRDSAGPRAGIENTHRGQLQAARSLALNEWQVFTRVVLPPALGRVWPAMVSQIVIVMLGSAVCGQIAAQELSYYANLIQSRNFRAFEAYIIATLLYLALAVGLRQLLRWAGPRFIFGR